MQLAVSNIAWEPHDDADILSMLQARGVRGIEIAPTKIWPDWQDATAAAAVAYRRFLNDRGFSVPALQAVLYGRPELTLFGTSADQQRLLDHLKHVADLAQALGAGVLVFGAPRNRDPGDLDARAAFEQAVTLFAAAAREAELRGTCLCIEPNPRQYGCRFVTESRTARALVAAVGSRGFRLHLDAAAMHLAGEGIASAIRRAIPVLKHFHASEPQLADFTAPVVDHRASGQALADGGYQGWISIEMKPAGAAALEEACVRVMAAYRQASSPDAPRGRR